MARITVVVDAPDHGTDAFSATGLITLGHEVVRLVKLQLPHDDNVGLSEAVVEASPEPVVEAPKPKAKRAPKSKA